MPQTSRIKTPFRQHLHRFRIGALPVLAFVACVALTLWLWQRQATIGSFLGEAETHTVTLTAGANGMLKVAENDVFWKRGDNVTKGQIIAELDDAEMRAQLRTIELQANKLAADVDAARINLDLELQGIHQDRAREEMRLLLEIEKRRLDLLQQRAMVSELFAQGKSLQTSLKFYRSLSGLAGEAQRLGQQVEYDRVKARYNEEVKVRALLESQLAEAEKLLADFPAMATTEVEQVLAPIRAEREVQQSLLNEVEAQLKSLRVTSPIDGRVTAVHRLPGEHVRAGDELVTIAVPSTEYIVSYVRENLRTPVYAGMKVGLRLRGDPGATEYTSRVESIGPIVEQVPPHQASTQEVMEWGNPVYIPIPEALQLRPGQLVHVIFSSSENRGGRAP